MLKTQTQKKIAVFLIVLIVLPNVAFFATPQRAEAQLVDPAVTALLTGILAATGDTALGIAALVTKDVIPGWDGIAWAIAKLILHQITASIVTWINSGFNGNPAFITDFGGFLLDTADQIAGRFIEGSELGFLCDPFELSIRIALSLPVFQQQIACRLTDVVGNVDNFLSGAFDEGGWPGWFNLVMYDNPYTHFLDSKAELEVRIAFANYQETVQLNWGRGFFSWRECSGEGAAAGTARAAQDENVDNCPIVTPGSVIETQLQSALGVGLDELKLADEFNEIITALIAQLVTQVLGGTGLLGASQSYQGTPSYTSRLNSDRSLISPILNSEQQTGFDAVNTAVNNEETYRGILEARLTSVTLLESTNEELRLCDVSRAAPFDSILQARESGAQGNLTAQDQLIADLEGLRLRIQGSTSSAEANSAAQVFLSFQTSGLLHSPDDILFARQEDFQINQELAQLRNNIEAEISACIEARSAVQNP